MVEDAIDKGVIREVQPIDIVLNIMSLCISTFIVAPKGYAIGECDSDARKEYIEHRKKDIIELVICGLRK